MPNRPLEHLARALAEGFVYQGEPSPHRGRRHARRTQRHLPPTAFVAFLQNHDQIGNRAFGERLSHLAPPEALAAWRSALLLLAPQIPLLFMGEEWAASTPFQFFVDFENEPDLAKAVRDGRRGEFKRFKAFTDPQMSQTIPDPTDRATFERSKIDWSEPENSPHREALSQTRELLDIRHLEIVPLLKGDYLGSRYTVSREKTLDVVWDFTDGILRMTANFGDGPVTTDRHPSARVLWTSPSLDLSGGILPPWSAIVTKGPSA